MRDRDPRITEGENLHIEVDALNKLEELKDKRFRSFRKNNPAGAKISDAMHIALLQDIQFKLEERKVGGDEYEREGLLDEVIRQVASEIEHRKKLSR